MKETTTGGKVETVGEIIKDAIALHELNPAVVEKELRLPAGTLNKLMADEIYTTCIPLVLLKNLIQSLHISIGKITESMLPTFKMMVSKETPETVKKKPLGYKLWENEECVLMYIDRLNTFFKPPSIGLR